MLYDDRDARPGVKFADAELLGIPHRIVVGERGLKAGTLEYRHRRATESEDFPQHAALEFLRAAPGSASPAAAARRCAARLAACVAALALLTAAAPLHGRAAPAAAPHASPVQPSAQQDPELRAVVAAGDPAGALLHRSIRFGGVVQADGAEAAPLRQGRSERLEILQTVYCETHRRGVSLLPPGLVMAVLDVESGFDRWAVSNAGAVGLMQVMPFWPEQLGMRRYELTHVAANISMGCAILRYYLDAEKRDVRRALERYNGAIGRREYPDRVIVRWTTYWNGADDLGRQSLNRS